MAIVRSYKGIDPTIGEDVFLAESAAVVGDVHIGSRSTIWYGAVLRGDVFHIRIGSETSIQDNAVVHVTSGQHAALVGDRVTVGHSVVLHGCTIGSHCIVGMGAVVMDRARVGSHCIVGAGALVTSGTDIPDGHLIIGSPARPKRKLTQRELDWIESSAQHYLDLGATYIAEDSGSR